jgi:transcriptional regulator with XRE-family HTH domain
MNNGNEAFVPQSDKDPIVDFGTPSSQVVLHRLGAVCRVKGISRRELAQRLGLTLQELRQQEQSPDLSVATLFAWAAKLGVPVTSLVVDSEEDSVPPTHLAQAQAARLMKLATRLRDRSRRRSIQRLSQTFVDQLVEIIPALTQLAKKNCRRSRRANPQSAAIVPRPLPEQVFTRGRMPRGR